MKDEKGILLPTAFQVKRVKMLTFFLDERGLKPGLNYKIDFNQSISANSLANLISLDLKIAYTIDSEEKEYNGRLAIECTVQNVFEVANLSSYVVSEANIQLPNTTIISFVSLAVTHSRAILAVQTAGTLFQENLLPIVNPVEMAQAMFPNFIPQDQKIAKQILAEDAKEPAKALTQLKKEQLSKAKKVVEQMRTVSQSVHKKAERTRKKISK